MIRIGITGGIASGKTFICKALEAAGKAVFYCDAEAKRIIHQDPQVKQSLQMLVGKDVYDTQGRLVKAVLASFICRGKEFSTQVDRIVHPKVALAWQQFCKSLPTQTPIVFMECALLFEAGFEHLVDLSVLIHVSKQTQLQRLMARDRISREKALEWMQLQLPEKEKLLRADLVWENEKHAHY